MNLHRCYVDVIFSLTIAPPLPSTGLIKRRSELQVYWKDKANCLQMDAAMDGIRDEVANRAMKAIHLCSINDNEAISEHWRLFTPICELIKGSVNDEKSIPHFLSRIDTKVSEMRRRMDATNLNQVVALNILQMFSGFVKFMKHLSHMDPSGTSPAEMTEEIERLKNEAFTYQTAYEMEKMEKEALRRGGDQLRCLVSEIFGFDEEKKIELFRQPVSLRPKKIGQGGPMTRGRKNTQLMRTVTTSETVTAPLPFPHPITLPFSSPPDDPALSFNSLYNLQSLFRANSVAPMDEKEPKKETKRRRRNESPSNGRMDEDEGCELKRSCGETVNGGDGGGEFNCPFDNCGRTFNRICTLSEHTTSDHYWQGALQLQCSLCGEKYDSERSFETHSLNCPEAEVIMTIKRWDHEETDEERRDRLELEKKLQSCPYPGCDYVSKSKSRSIFKHMNKSHGNDGRASYKCDCGKKRRTLHTLLFHRYSECRHGVIDWFIESPAALKTEDWTDDGSVAGT